MPQITEQMITAAINSYFDPILDRELGHINALQSIDLKSNGTYALNLQFGFPIGDHDHQLRLNIEQHMLKSIGRPPETISLTIRIKSHRVQAGTQTLSSVKNIIAIASGKGGVGKSTTAVNLACALAALGAKTGLLDADIYGPSQPQMLGHYERPSANQQRMQPVLRHGVQTMSMGYLVDKNAAMVWRGPMVSRALQQLLRDTDWQDLDYLIIDLPPGTGDVQLTLAQHVPLTAAVVVTTPQDLALLDVRRAVNMFNKVNIPTLGIIENMSYHVCEKCGHEVAMFGTGGGEAIAEEFGIRLLGQIPLAPQIRELTDHGQPIVVAEPESSYGMQYLDLARHIGLQLSLRGQDFSSKFPNIVIEEG